MTKVVIKRFISKNDRTVLNGAGHVLEMIINIISKRQTVNSAKRVKRCRHHLLTILTNDLLSSYMLTGIEIQWILASLLFSDLTSKVFINRVYLLIRARYV
ncbi:hypothetical protein HanHA300_Chr05g0179641 [Helianthus annuus]|nr:hypothetical protein HanHA300_Chr05g0179641 [Helianthus annuus]KAJ0584921.1 hypothetical protein HanHA89_Chr05g0194341 [Helianthus annuus]KAJ0750587.1 hypothetical protein HanLR1_Chr05g0183701 [Helianthus annuus]